MYGDTAAIRSLARSLRGQAHEIREEADRLVGLADTCGWQGRAAEAMRRRCRDRAGLLVRSASGHEDAAAALDRHADRVDDLKELIGAIERRARSVLDDLLGGGLDALLDRFVPPPPGHRDWLEVDLGRLR